MTLPEQAEVVICGAGIAGVAVAHQLTVHAGVRDVLLVDDRPPLTLTSDKSTEAYRNFWPGPDGAMIALMNRSLDLMEELARGTDNVFRLNRRGYLYATAVPARAAALERAATAAAAQGAGPLRVHDHADSGGYAPSPPEVFEHQPLGADLIVQRALLRRHFPYLTDRAVAALHVRRCGWFSGQQLGMLLLERARTRGAVLAAARLEAVEVAGGRVHGVVLREGRRTQHLRTSCFVDAAGPHLVSVAALLGIELPVFCELHLKASFRDTRGAVPRAAPLLIWDDPQELEWSDEERELLAAQEDSRGFLGLLPAGVHARPEGTMEGEQVLVLWPYHAQPVEPHFPLPEEPQFAEIALRGMATMLPGLRAYLDAVPRTFVDGGYYVKTRENRCLVGPLPVGGAYVLGALSGYGLMVACGAAELLGAHITGAPLPEYAGAFTLSRYDDPAYRGLLEDWGPTGEL